jgi:uncharacterized membrane protein YhaH (DUF805 family)
MGEAFKTCMRKYADFSGRARRSEYWWFYLVVFLIELPFQIVFMVFYLVWFASFTKAIDDTDTLDWSAVNWSPLIVGWLVILIPVLVFFIPNLAAMARRLHDMGQSGHWLWLTLVGLGIVPLIMCIMDGQAFDNQWGPDPKAAERVGWGQRTAPPAPPVA